MNLVSPKVKKIVKIYYPQKYNVVVLKLQEYCDYLSEFLADGKKPESYERFLIAILKIGRSSEDKLDNAIELGKSDFRDLLVSAGFGNSLTAHEERAKKYLTKHLTRRINAFMY